MFVALVAIHFYVWVCLAFGERRVLKTHSGPLMQSNSTLADSLFVQAQIEITGEHLPRSATLQN